MTDSGIHRLGINRATVAALLATLAGIVLLMWLVDRPVADLVRGSDGPVIAWFRTITVVGDSKWYLVTTGVAALVLAVVRCRLPPGRTAVLVGWALWALVFVFLAVALSGLLANLIKVLVGRARPKLLDLDGVYGFSPFTGDADYHAFPSGHSNTAVALALALGFLLPRLRPWLLAVAALVAASRVAIGAHYPADVIGGALLAVLTTWVLRAAFVRWRLVFSAAGVRAPGRILLRRARWPGVSGRCRAAGGRLGGRPGGG